MQKVLTFLKGKQAKRFYWNTANGAIGLAITYMGGLDYIYAPVIIALLNGLTKEINKYNK